MQQILAVEAVGTQLLLGLLHQLAHGVDEGDGFLSGLHCPGI